MHSLLITHECYLWLWNNSNISDFFSFTLISMTMKVDFKIYSYISTSGLRMLNDLSWTLALLQFLLISKALLSLILLVRISDSTSDYNRSSQNGGLGWLVLAILWKVKVRYSVITEWSLELINKKDLSFITFLYSHILFLLFFS